MLRHPHYLEIPWEVHWHEEPHRKHRHLWLIAGLVLLALLLIGVHAAGGF